MYGIPEDLDLTPVIGESTSHVGVGQFDLTFSFGPVGFAVQSTIKIFRDDKLLAEWQEGRWPDPSFYDVMNTDVNRCDITRSEGGDRIEFEFDNGLIMHLVEDRVPFESMQITIDGKMWII